ncbi:MAG: hypothetical protein CR217_08855 [Beijerinckiaceae bacterium]|nr:MAG: hypothetical protein CR217_08855 [Beijerinckiaceae bacterium]
MGAFEAARRILSECGQKKLELKDEPYRDFPLAPNPRFESPLGNKTSAPQYWPLDRFDLVWVFHKRDGTWTFTQVPQLLLAGDRPDVID